MRPAQSYTSITTKSLASRRTEQLLPQVNVVTDWTPHRENGYTAMNFTGVFDIDFELSRRFFCGHERNRDGVGLLNIVDAAVVPPKLKRCVLYTNQARSRE